MTHPPSYSLAIRLFLQAAPDKAMREKIYLQLLSLDGVRQIYHLHLWSLDGEKHVKAPGTSGVSCLRRQPKTT